MKITPKFIIFDDDPALLGKFTTYIKLVAEHAHIDYMRTREFRVGKSEFSLEEVSQDVLSYEDPLPSSGSEFVFDEERLENEFNKLNLLRQQILTLIFVERLTAAETAARLDCSVDCVYKQKHRAIKIMRDQLMNGGDERGE